MKDSYPQVSLMRFCRLFGITRQAFYQHSWDQSSRQTKHDLILGKIREIRTMHPVMGTRKLLCLLEPFLAEHDIKIGRDALFNLLSANKMLVRKRKRKISTTQSRHWLKKYPNLTKGWYPKKPLQLWVADITYVPLKRSHLYLSLITDAYSHRIMGYQIADTLHGIHTTRALQMALTHYEMTPDQLIHHSDRGLQYCNSEYVNLLEEHKIKISMTENSDPLENPIAERINGIIKEEYLKHYSISNRSQAMILLDTIVCRYNQQRPHQSIKMLTPETVHTNKLLVNRQWSKQKHLSNIVTQKL